MAEDPEIVAVWMPIDRGSFSYTPPFSVAWILERHDELYVHFQPGNSRGEDAKFLSRTFSRCIRVHDPDAEIEITTGKIAPDLR
jgi:hypothetical protein